LDASKRRKDVQDMTELHAKYVFQDGADFYQDDADDENATWLWTASFKVGMDSALADKARAEFRTWAAMNAFRPVFQ
jgi:hypothetical protein